MKLSICIPVFNNYQLTKNCLRYLAKLPSDHQVILVDNGSTDQTACLGDKTQDDLPKNFLYLSTDVNQGFGWACNKAFAASEGEYVLFLNNDIVVQDSLTNWTRSIIDAASEGAIVSITSGLLDADFNFAGEFDFLQPGNSYLSGWCLGAKKEIFSKLIPAQCEGPFDNSSFFLFYEDVDLSFRAKQLGIPLKTVQAPIKHLEHMTVRNYHIRELIVSRQIFSMKWKEQLKTVNK